jgi:hypothetical protein
VTSAALTFVGVEGESIEVISKIRDKATEPDPRKTDLPDRSTKRQYIPLDGVPIEFEIAQLGGGRWYGFGHAPDVDISLQSTGIAVDGLRLERLHHIRQERSAVSWSPPNVAERFPDGWLHASARPESAACSLELEYRDRLTLTGHIHGESVTLEAHLPKVAAVMAGKLGDVSIRAALDLIEIADVEDPGDWQSRRSVSLRSHEDGVPIDLRAELDCDADGWFQGGWVAGTLDNEQLTGNIQRVEGGLSSSSVMLTGSVGPSRLQLFGTVDASMTLGLVRGTIGGNSITIEARVTSGRRVVNVSGSFPGPAPLALLCSTSLLYFL